MQRLDDVTSGDEVYGVPCAMGACGIICDTAVFPEPPRSWSIFWEPEFAGRYGVNGTSPGAENVLSAALSLGVEKADIFELDLVDSPRLRERLKLLADNSSVQWPGVAGGKYLKGLAFGASWGMGLADMTAMGEKWDFTVPDEGATGWIDVMVVTEATNRDPIMRRIAEDYIDFFISAQEQLEVVVRQLSYIPENSSCANR